MKQLYITILDILTKIPNVKWVDLNIGQLQQENPPVAFPAVLINLGNFKCEEIGDAIQRVYVSFTLTLVCQALSDTSNQAPETMRNQSLSFLDLAGEIYQKMQGFESKAFYPFERTAMQIRQFKGLNVVEFHFETAFEDDTANS